MEQPTFADVSFERYRKATRRERFLDEMARRNGGRVLGVSADRLGDYVVTDYVRARTRR